VTYGLDNHLGLFNGIIQSNINFFFKYFEIIYVPALIIILIIFFTLLILYTYADQQKISKIFIITLSTLFLFNFFDDTKSYKKIPFFQEEKKERYSNSTLVLVWDEMSGLNSLSSKTTQGEKVNQNFEKFFKKYNFDFYPNSYSISDNSVTSLTSLINYKQDLNFHIENYVTKATNYFNEYEIKKNLFFNQFNSISVIQNIHINYCNNDKVIKCYQYNPLNLEVLGTESDPLSNIISAWSLNGSIIGKFVWRILKQMNLISSTLEPEGEKLFINEIMSYAYNDLISKKYDLVFLHVLVPHKPYGFNQNCLYDVKISNLNIFLSNIESIKQHNIERNCVILLMDKFFEKIQNLSNHEVFIISDHGSRITREDISSLSTIFAHKKRDNIFSNKYPIKISNQNLFKKINNE
tara:strand:- start:441 stop:1664 length:1224 start_codon:yes stop_codon:yes gene_type:complete